MTERSEFIRGPKWRTRTTPRRRVALALATFTALVAIGAVVMWLVIRLVDALGAPGWVVALPWLVPSLITLAWNLHRPGPAVLSDDDDESWTGYSLRTVLVGVGTRRPAPVRALAALAFGGPIGWLMVVGFLLELSGVL